MIRVYVIGETRSHADALEEVLARTGRLEVAGVAVDPTDALADLAGLGVDVVLLDLAAPTVSVWASAIRAAAPGVLVVVMARKDSEPPVLAWTEADVAGYVGYQASLDELVRAIEGITRVRSPSRPRDPADLPELSNRRIAGDTSGIAEKLHVHRRPDAVAELRGGGSVLDIAVATELPAPRPITQFRVSYPQALIRNEDARPHR